MLRECERSRNVSVWATSFPSWCNATEQMDVLVSILNIYAILLYVQPLISSLYNKTGKSIARFSCLLINENLFILFSRQNTRVFRFVIQYFYSFLNIVIA